jgi:hypothetical protein
MTNKMGFWRIAMTLMLSTGVTGTVAAQSPPAEVIGGSTTIRLAEWHLRTGADAGPPESLIVSPFVQGRPSLPLHLGFGAAAGTRVGFAAGALLMASADEWIAPPAFYYTVPAGVAAGAVTGLVVYLLRR